GSLGYEVKLQQLTKKDVDGIFIQLLPNGKPVLILEHPNTGTVIRVIPECAYTSQGQFRSISFIQRPDIAIEILPVQGSPYIYLFDPKYKLDSERQEEGQGNGKPKKEDIDKMHTYRDAIRGEKGISVVQYAAIMYPGIHQNYEEGIEALQAYPGLEGLLEDRLQAIFSAALRT